MDIDKFLNQNENKDLLRFITCGAVDDGKSTLIGRLLYDSKLIFEDQLKALQSDSEKVGTTQGTGEIDYALLLDGLKAEREQGITIDVAYRYFATPKRKFIIADTPGHEEYTRNMATGASTANLAVILIDARAGVITQTKRHAFIASLLGIKHIVVAVNKMDLMDYQEEVFQKIKSAVTDTNRKRKSDPGNPYICNVFSLHELVSSPKEIEKCSQGCRNAQIGCVECKKILSNNIIKLLQPFQFKRKELENQPNVVENILLDGKHRAQKIIRNTLKEVRKKVGLFDVS